MEQDKNKAVFRKFGRSAELFGSLGESAAIFLASMGSDLSLVIEEDGTIFDIAYRNPELAAWNCDNWVGRKWRDVVTEESLVKIDALFEDAGRQVVTRRRQLNHPARNTADLPVDYCLVSFPGVKYRLALGNDLRQLATLQRQLVQFQMELESEYRKIRENEARYRTLFHISGEAVVVVGEQDLKILDANQAAAEMAGRPLRKMTGESLSGIFDKASREAALAKLQEVRTSGRSQTFPVRLAGSPEECMAVAEPYREAGRTNMVIRLSRADAATKPGPAQPEVPAETLPEALALTDGAGEILAANDAFLDLVNCHNPGQVIGKRLSNWLGGSSVDLQVLMTRLRAENSIRGFATLVRDEFGVDSAVVVSASRTKAENGPERFAFLVMEAARRQSALAGPAGQHLREMGDFSELVGRVPLKELIREASDVIEVMCIEAALRQTDNNRASAAELLGLSRQSLYLKLRRYGLSEYGSDE